MTKEHIFFNILKQVAKNISFSNFCNFAKDFPFYHSNKLANIEIQASIFGRTYFYKLEKFIPKYIGNHTKLEAYAKINQYIDDYLQFIKKDLTNDKINNYIRDTLLADCDRLGVEQRRAASELIEKINVTDAAKQIYNLIEKEYRDKRKWYALKIKSWINSEFEQRIQQSNTNTPQIFSLKELKNLNDIGKIFIIDNSVIAEIDNAIDKFIWIDYNYIDTSMGYGSNHAVMQKNYIRERRGEKIEEFDNDYISNTRSPEDLACIDINEEEANLHVAYGSFYFNNQVCIIEGKYKITESDYNQLLKELTKRFTHVFDFTLQGRQLKQEAKLHSDDNIYKNFTNFVKSLDFDKYFNIDNLNIYSLLKKVNTDNFINNCVKIFDNLEKDKIIIKIYNDFIKEYNYTDINPIIINKIELYLKKNFNALARVALTTLYPTDRDKQRVINKFIKSNQQIKETVIRAYNRVKTLLKNEAPDLELLPLKENHISVTNQTGVFAAIVKEHTRANSIRLSLQVSKQTVDKGFAFLMSTLYHEIIHCIKNQGSEGQKLYHQRWLLNKNKGNDWQHQQEIHNDEIWDRANDIIRNHTHFDLDYGYASDEQYPWYKGDNISKELAKYRNNLLLNLNETHEATLICYNCGWFNMYREWNNDCEQAKNDMFFCPKCHENNVKLIFPGPGEKELIDDAFTHIHYQAAEQKKQLALHPDRLKHREERSQEIQSLEEEWANEQKNF